ncbi:MAG: undecaprenyl/decaprenyl-phosphate alpha-N-acetylglucosaminyl 1-phosphate transferase [Deltaproteobacteria bacterium]|nr:undecaprenyl/decaprenyl-phosphate alpha-N-acetylglucosaminyl 1-phosphate transferase [Deltaproteobacteria bacterium]
MPILREIALKFNLVDQPGGRKIHSIPTAYLGGIGVVFSIMISFLCLYAMIQYQIEVKGNVYFSFGRENIFWIHLLIFSIAAMVISLVGLMDDIKILDFKVKLCGQLVIAALMILSGVYLHLFDHWILNVAFSVAWYVIFTNAFNLLDNMNGLTAGISAIVFLFLSVLAYVTQNFLLSFCLIIFCGSLLGFLPFNFPKASIFLGDAGSLFIGFSIASFGVLMFNHLILKGLSNPYALFVLAAILVVPCLDTLTVSMIRIKNKKPIYIGDTNHLSHLLTRSGLSAVHAVLVLYGLSFVFGFASMIYFLTLK